MVNGLLVLGGLCSLLIITANQAVKSEESSTMDFYEFYGVDRPELMNERKPLLDHQPMEKVQLRVIKGGKAAQ